MFDIYAAAKIGNTRTTSFLSASWSSAFALLTDKIVEPVLIVIWADQDVHVSQGASDMANPSSTDNAPLIKSNVYWPIVVDSDVDRYVKLRGASANGNIRFTNVTYLGTR